MATRGTIALEYADGTVDQIYSHWDNYLSHNGRILFEHYSDPFKLQELIDLGSLSSLGQDIGTKHPFSQFEAKIPGEEYESRYGNMTTFYGRDRGESDTQACRFASFEDYVAKHQYEEFEYILRTDGNWYVSHYSNKDYTLLAPKLNALETA